VTSIATQRDELGEALTQLKATQDQLVQSEKMTFLGELTAGIAHELQNPLAFVKNFAEVSSVLIDDMTDTAPRSPNPDSSQEVLLAGLRQNLREISQHGQRATSIIADMLARSRNGSSPRSQVDLNALLTEYLRPAYQGLRAKNKSFTATRTTHPAGSPPCARPSCDVRPGPRIHQPVYQCFLRGAAAPAGPRARLRTRINYNHPPNARRSR
jgi:two-component system NtrC family sensor kinase